MIEIKEQSKIETQLKSENLETSAGGGLAG